jgi:uncharacterized membrane protein YvbJ
MKFCPFCGAKKQGELCKTCGSSELREEKEEKKEIISLPFIEIPEEHRSNKSYIFLSIYLVIAWCIFLLSIRLGITRLILISSILIGLFVVFFWSLKQKV